MSAQRATPSSPTKIRVPSRRARHHRRKESTSSVASFASASTDAASQDESTEPTGPAMSSKTRGAMHAALGSDGPSSMYGQGGSDAAGSSQASAGSANMAAAAGEESSGSGNARERILIKVAMVGDSGCGKTSLMVRYVEGSFNEDYIQTLGVNFMEKTISIRNTEITFSIWDLGGQREFVNMLPLVCNDAIAILYMFDLSRKSTLNSIKEWYRQSRGFNKTAIPFLVGTKYDEYSQFSPEEQEETSQQARRFARAMRAPLVFCSSSHAINIQKIFKIILSKAFDLKCTIPEIAGVGEPILLYVDT